jgi:hypothetical protein
MATPKKSLDDPAIKKSPNVSSESIWGVTVDGPLVQRWTSGNVRCGSEGPTVAENSSGNYSVTTTFSVGRKALEVRDQSKKEGRIRVQMPPGEPYLSRAFPKQRRSKKRAILRQ